MLDLAITVAGFVPLILGANALVEGASSLARRFKIPEIVIGLTIVAFGTSTPELVVNLNAAAEGNAAIALGNILGSNIFNVMGILGVSAMIRPLAVKTGTTWIEIPLTLLSAALVMLASADAAVDGAPWSGLSRIDGGVFLMFFMVFLAYTVALSLRGSGEEAPATAPRPWPRSALMILAGLGGLMLGGRVIVEFASRFAAAAGVPERVIALTIVAIGTSLPELATSVAAALKGSTDIAIGNVVGSNVFNMFFILGLSATISPVPAAPASWADMAVNAAASLALFAFVFTGKGRSLERWEGALLAAGYLAYLAFLIAAPA